MGTRWISLVSSSVVRSHQLHVRTKRYFRGAWRKDMLPRLLTSKTCVSLFASIMWLRNSCFETQHNKPIDTATRVISKAAPKLNSLPQVFTREMSSSHLVRFDAYKGSVRFSTDMLCV